MKDVRIIKTYSRKVGRLVFKGRHEATDLVPLVAFIPDGSEQEEPPYILYGRDHDNYHLETPKNLTRMTMLQEIDAEIEELKETAKCIIMTMTDPIYAESYWVHAEK